MAWVLCPAAIVWAGGIASGQTAVPHAAPPPQLFPLMVPGESVPDTPLRLTFAALPTIGSGGRIQIVDAADGRVVETIDVGSPIGTQTIGGLSGFKYRPVIVAGTELTIHPRNGALAYGKTYDVRIDANVLRDDPAGTQVSVHGPRGASRPRQRRPPRERPQADRGRRRHRRLRHRAGRVRLHPRRQHCSDDDLRTQRHVHRDRLLHQQARDHSPGRGSRTNSADLHEQRSVQPRRWEPLRRRRRQSQRRGHLPGRRDLSPRGLHGPPSERAGGGQPDDPQRDAVRVARRPRRSS